MEFYNTYNNIYIDLATRSTVYPVFKIDLLDYMENVIDSLTPDINENGNGSISINYGQGVYRTCTLSFNDPDGRFLPNSRTTLFGFNNKFKLYVGLKDIYTGDIYWWSQGVFYTVDPQITQDGSQRYVTTNGIDKFGRLSGDLGYGELTATHLIRAGTNLYKAIKDILLMDAGGGQVIDPIPPLLDPLFANEEIPYDINKDPGCFIGDILIELANIIGCDIFYDSEGRLNVRSGTYDYYYSEQAPLWEFTDEKPEYIAPSTTLNTKDVVNSVTVVSSNSNLNKVYVSTKQNTNAMSGVSVDQIGLKEKYITSSNIFSQQNADEYAEYELKKLSIIATQHSWQCTCIPHLTVNKVVEVTNHYMGLHRERFIVQSIEIPLKPSELMSISASNIASLPYYQIAQ